MMRWKKQPHETGLRAVVAGPYRASDLRIDGVRVAQICPLGGDWRSGLEGWYFVAGWGHPQIPHRNTYCEFVATEAEAKAQAEQYVKHHLKATGEKS